MIPTKIGPFEIVTPLATTGGGLLYRAKDPNRGRSVMIRVMPHSLGEVRLRRFRQEAKAASALESPNIASFLGGGECDDGFFAVVEYVEGNTLLALLKENRQPPYEVMDLCRQACIALDHAAAHKIVHPNLTPANVMVGWDGTLKILDFAVPKVEAESSAQDFERLQLERLHYASPEQLHGEELDRRSNLYSWGATLYEMVAGKPPFTAESASDLRRKILEDDPAPPHTFNNAWNESVSSVILKALSKARGERYASGAEFIRELERHQKKPLSWVPPAAVTRPLTPIVGGNSTAALRPLAVGVAATAVLEPPAPQAAASSLASPRQVAAALFSQPAAFADAAHTVGKARPSASAPQPPQLKNRVHEETVRIVSIPVKPNPAAPGKLTTRVAALAVVVVSLSLATGLYWRHRHSSSTHAAQPVTTVSAPVTEEKSATQDMSDISMTEIVPSGPVRKKTQRPTVTVSLPTPVVATGEVVVNSMPSGADFQIDGRRDSGWVTPNTITGLSVGQHTIVLTKTGYAQQSHTFEVSAGNKTILASTLTELPGTLMVASDPAGAAIMVDGKDSGRMTPSHFVVVKGVHVIALRKPGFFEATTTAEVNPGQNFTFSPALKEMGNAESVKSAGKLKKFFGSAPKDMASVQIKTQPKGARVSVNNRVLEKVTPLEFFLEPGNYEVAVTVEGYKTLHRSVTLQKDSKLVIDEPLEKQP